MSDYEIIDLYDKLAEDSIYSSSFVTYDRALTDYIGYDYRQGPHNNKYKIDFMNRFLPVFDKIKEELYLPITLVDLFGYINHTSQFKSVYIPQLLQLSYFPDDCFDFDGKTRDEIAEIYRGYLYVIEYLNNFISYDRCDINSRSTYLIEDAMKHIARNHSYNRDLNSLIPNIILYCIMNKYNSDKLIEMIDYSFLHLNELYNYIELNSDGTHDFEICLKVMEDIENNVGTIKEIR